jgi:SAM-dependent methyltransferase
VAVTPIEQTTGPGSGQRIYAALATLRTRLAPPGTRRARVAGHVLATAAVSIERLAGNGDTNGARDPLTPASSPDFLHVRARVASEWIRGDGLELGALHLPLPLPPHTSVRYVDRMAAAELRRQYPELSDKRLVEPDLIENGETLASIPDESVDFVVANHFIEHCRDPIGTSAALLRVVRSGGVVFLAVPDKRETFDRDRPVTTLDHLIRDHESGPAWSERAHFEEWVELVDHGPGADPVVDDLIRRDASIHFHVWTPLAFLELVRHCHESLDVPFDLSLLMQNGPEFLVILTRLP